MIRFLIPLTVLYILMMFSQLSAESVFLKNGSIVEGNIVFENKETITVSIAGGNRVSLSRDDVIRILYYSDYRNRYFITKKDGTVLDVFLVEERPDSYSYREELSWPDEYTVLKKDVSSTVKDSSGIKKVSSYDTFFRAGITSGLNSGGAPENSPGIHGFFLDIIPGRKRFAGGISIELFSRAQYARSKVNGAEGLGYADIDGYSITDSSRYERFSGGAGGRAVLGKMYAGWLWQMYALAYVEYSRIKLRLDYTDISTHTNRGEMRYRYNSFGAAGGLGFEIAFSRFLGCFAEITGGYSPAFKNRTNCEALQARTGMSIRVSFQ
jgi:hypothetical protein